MRILNVAEKNDAAKGLSAIMSRGQSRKREGFSKFNKIYEFNCNILNANAQMVMTSVSGHLMGLEFSQAYRKWNSCSPLQLFTAPVAKYVGEDYQKIKRTLEREVRGSQALIIWTDCDREGENIGFEIIDVCTKVCPRIQLYRARFSEITPQSVSRACANLVAPDNLQAEAVDVRMELDLRIGAAFTRFQTLRLSKVFPNMLGNQLISYGSCQFPTLGFVVDRYKQVEQFVPEQFFKIKVTHETPTDKVDFIWKRGRLYHRTPCLILYQMCLESNIWNSSIFFLFPQNPTAVVTGTSSRPKSKWRPVALDTVELEKLASRKMRINAKETMKIAEKLYNKGFISYPRTETNMFPSSLNLVELIEKQTQDQEWGGFATGVLTQGPNPRQGRKTDNAHPPIHPTNYTNNLQFTATGLMILERNYLEVYPYERWSDKTIPVYNQGQQFQPTSIEMVEGETSPPPLLSEADLIALMEKNGIGTDATHADHIETIKSRSYVGVQGDGTFLPGQLGMGLVEGYDLMRFEFSKPKLRAGLEADLKSYDFIFISTDVLREQIAKYREIFVQAAQEAIKLDQALSAYFGNPETYSAPEFDQVQNPQVRLCPRCQQEQMTLRKTKDGNYMVGCLGYPHCRASVFLPKFVLNAEVDESLCHICGPGQVHQLKFTFKRGSVPPMIPLQHTGCIGGCDEMLRETLDIRDISSSTLQTGEIVNIFFLTSFSDENSVVCTCGVTATMFSVKKEGPNKGRQFYRCSQREGGCDFFLWADSGASVSSHQSTSSSSTSTGDVDNSNETVCNCNEPAVSRTVKKDGPNQGRLFYACPKPMGQGCSFFQWADQDGPPAQSRGFGTTGRGTGRGRGAGTGRGAGRGSGGGKKRKCGNCRMEGRNIPYVYLQYEHRGVQ
ncbi:hypothetical protein QZH41_012648 [Actinostola sp. cb2023]|nr:hypothetical protein QZH41_012648 [Actinostola sp. cb2023]